MKNIKPVQNYLLCFSSDFVKYLGMYILDCFLFVFEGALSSATFGEVWLL